MQATMSSFISVNGKNLSTEVYCLAGVGYKVMGRTGAFNFFTSVKSFLQDIGVKLLYFLSLYKDILNSFLDRI